MNQPARGEVWWFEDPDIGRRPGLILTRQAAIPVLHWVLVAPLTRTIRGIPTELALDQDDGVTTPSAVTFDNVRPIRKALLVERLTTLSAARMTQACACLQAAVDC